ALSSTNRIAIIDTATYAVTGHIDVRAQDPRAIAVEGSQLYVLAFESGNQSEISMCTFINSAAYPTGTGQGAPNDGNQCTIGLDSILTFATDPNIPGITKNIVIDPDVPDRDLFLYDTGTGAELDDVSGISTLLYGIAVDSTGQAFIAMADARNQENGDDGTNLIDLDNRMFLNQVGSIACGGGSCGAPTVWELEPAPPTYPTAGDELATPYGITVSDDDTTLVLTAMGTSRVFTMNASTGAVLDILDLGTGPDAGLQNPRGLALASDGAGAPETAYVLNTLENTVSVIDVSDPSSLSEVTKIPVGSDPTPDAVRLGRNAFNNAFASTSGTFSCGSCHPDGNTDQLLWRIGGACSFGACNGHDEARTTMPIRGLKNTLPLHWDGSLGDPFGGGNGSVGFGGAGGTDCTLGDADGDHDCFLDLVDASLSGVMCDPDAVANPAGCPSGGNELSAQEIDDMAIFLANVSYPPARMRSMNDVVSASALDGFRDFFMDQGDSSVLGGGNDPDTCADSTAGCHDLPLGAGTNSSTLNGFDAPTMRGMTDRFIHFSLGITTTEEILVLANAGADFSFFIPGLILPPLEPAIQWDPNEGFEEITSFGAAFMLFELVYGTRPIDTFQMFEEASTGFSGSQGRQVTLNLTTTTGGNLADTETLMSALELADQSGFVNVRAVGRRNGGLTTLSYLGGPAVYLGNNNLQLTHAQMVAEAQAGTSVMTLTGHLRKNVGLATHPMPLLAQLGTGSGTTGDPPLPRISANGSADPPAFTVTGIDVRSDALLLLDGVFVAGTLTCAEGVVGFFCDDGNSDGDIEIDIDLDSRPSAGTYLLQVQNRGALLSNELPFCVGNTNDCV
ncbi:MAG: hypothetical protein O7G30_10470, partial [Proteobacteria bacterium]|nr:hypothetical protein [Pseudomonadota bacterium]